ncbi:MAG: hypothetical protein EOO41_00375 [Methanobacteriota archaeon]|nr:MAG: hypothetical protein EOO41_00375 [Euryarchaeota archaeon]
MLHEDDDVGSEDGDACGDANPVYAGNQAAMMLGGDADLMRSAQVSAVADGEGDLDIDVDDFDIDIPIMISGTEAECGGDEADSSQDVEEGCRPTSVDTQPATLAVDALLPNARDIAARPGAPTWPELCNMRPCVPWMSSMLALDHMGVLRTLRRLLAWSTHVFESMPPSGSSGSSAGLVSAPAPGQVSNEDDSLGASLTHASLHVRVGDDANGVTLHEPGAILRSTLAASATYSQATDRAVRLHAERTEDATRATIADMQHHVALMQSQLRHVMSPALAAWLFALLARLDVPLLPDTASMLRQLFLLCLRQTAWLEAASHQLRATNRGVATLARPDAHVQAALERAELDCNIAASGLAPLLHVTGTFFHQRVPGE